MASSAVLLKPCCCFFALLCLSTCCNAGVHDEKNVGIVENAMACFTAHYIYVSCQDSYRLNAGGTIHVPPEATDEYCNGPCLVETRLVLDCVERALCDFKFYNGVSVMDVKYTLSTGCSHTSKRGDFNVVNQSKVNPEAHPEAQGGHVDYFHDDGNRESAPAYSLLILLGSVLLLCSN